MTTKYQNISEAVIKRYAADAAVKEINDPRYPLRFRFAASRDKGSWFYVRGKRWKKIGEWPLVKFSDVTKKLPEIEINIASGLSHDIAVTGHFEAVSDLLDWYLERVAVKQGLKPTRKQGIKTAINCYLSPRVGSLWMADVSRQEVDKRLMMAMQRDGYSISTISLAFGVLKSAFKQAHSSGHIDINLTEGMRFSDFIPEAQQPKESNLMPNDIPSVLSRVREIGGDGFVMSWLMALHGSRIGETRLARWDEFDFSSKVWNIPASNAKNGKAIKVPLTEHSIELLNSHKQSQEQKGYSGVWLFKGSKRSAKTPTQANNAIKQVSDGEWTAHDLRKAYRDIHNEIGTDYLLAERMINHSLTKLDKTYNQKDHLERARIAQERAHEWIFSRCKD